jgi:hypothetical protein
MPPGSYDIAITAGLEKLVRRSIVVHVGDIVNLPFTLMPGSATEQITVVGQTPLLEEKSVTLGQVMEEREIVQLPLNGRNYLDLGRLAAVPKQGSRNQTFSAYGNTGLSWAARATRTTYAASTTAPATCCARRWRPQRIPSPDQQFFAEFDAFRWRCHHRHYQERHQPMARLRLRFSPQRPPGMRPTFSRSPAASRYSSKTSSMFWRGAVTRSSVQANNPLPAPAQDPADHAINFESAAYGYTRTLITTLVNELRFSWTRMTINQDETTPLDDIMPGLLDPNSTQRRLRRHRRATGRSRQLPAYQELRRVGYLRQSLEIVRKAPAEIRLHLQDIRPSTSRLSVAAALSVSPASFPRTRRTAPRRAPPSLTCSSATPPA